MPLYRSYSWPCGAYPAGLRRAFALWRLWHGHWPHCLTGFLGCARQRPAQPGSAAVTRCPAGKEARTSINEDESEGEEKGVKLLTLNSSPSTARKCSSGTGRLVVDTTCTGFRLVRPIHSENSLVLGVVADKNTMLTWSGSRMMTSSHTTPRSMSFT